MKSTRCDSIIQFQAFKAHFPGIKLSRSRWFWIDTTHPSYSMQLSWSSWSFYTELKANWSPEFFFLSFRGRIEICRNIWFSEIKIHYITYGDIRISIVAPKNDQSYSCQDNLSSIDMFAACFRVGGFANFDNSRNTGHIYASISFLPTTVIISFFVIYERSNAKKCIVDKRCVAPSAHFKCSRSSKHAWCWST